MQINLNFRAEKIQQDDFLFRTRFERSESIFAILFPFFLYLMPFLYFFYSVLLYTVVLPIARCSPSNTIFLTPFIVIRQACLFQGETKVLVTGPWSSGHNYQVLIDGLAVSATLIQEGVLRCICPGKSFLTSTECITHFGQDYLVNCFQFQAETNFCLSSYYCSKG